MADRTVTVALVASTAQYQAAMAKAAAATVAVDRQAGRTAAGVQRSMGKTGKSARDLTQDFFGISPALIGAGGVAYGMKKTADAAIGWESAFAGVKKTVAGTPEQLQAINDGLRDMSAEIPTSKEELAAIAESAGQLGIETDSVLDFTRVIADLGETTNLSAEQGATELARFANITQMSQGDFDRLASTIVDLGNNFATTESEISTMAQRIAGAGSQVGFAEADILAVATALSSVGIEAEAGGTAVSRVMIEIDQEVENGGDKLAKFAEVAGMTAEDFAAAWEKDPAKALGSFVTGLGEMEANGGSALGVLEDLEITEIRMRDALLRASGAGDLFNDTLDTANTAWGENNALTEEAAQRYDTTESKIQKAKNAAGNLATELGETLLPTLGEVAEAAAIAFDWEIPGTGGGDAGNMGVGATIGQGLLNQVNPRAAFEAEFDRRGGQRPAGPSEEDLYRPTYLTQQTSLQQRMDAPAPDWSRVEAGTDVLNDVTEAADRADQIMRNMEGPDPDWSRVDAGTGVLDGVRSASERALEKTHAASHPNADWSRIEAGTQVLDTQGMQAEDTKEKIDGYIEILDGATDPVLRLKQAMDGVDEAQTSYNEAVDEYGKNSPEAQDAAFNLAEAVRQAEVAAIDGELSFGKFDDKLNQWVEMGVITADQADAMRERVKELRGEAEDYEGGYDAQLEAWTDEAEAKIDAAAQAAQDYEDENYIANFGANTAAAHERIRRLKNAIAGIDRSINITTTVTNQGEVAANIPGRGRFLSHSGGMITPQTAGWMPGLASDERMRILQTGEMVVSRHGMAQGASTTNNNSKTVNVYGETTPKQRFRARQLVR